MHPQVLTVVKIKSIFQLSPLPRRLFNHSHGSRLSAEYYELCLPNSRANIGLSLVDGVVCLILLILSVLGIAHFCQHGFKLCFETEEERPGRRDAQMAVILPGQSAAPGHLPAYVTVKP